MTPKPKFELYSDSIEYQKTLEPSKSKSNKKPRNQSGRFNQINFLVDSVCRTMTPTQSLIAMIVWRHIESDGTAKVSFNWLAELTGLHRDTIRINIKELIDRKIIIRLKKGSNLTHQSNVYRMGKPDEID